jgi:hypothetical protein
MATYDKDDQVRVTATFTSNDVATNTTLDPANKALHHKPSGDNVEVNASSDETGIYYADIDLDQIGTHTVKFTGTTPVKAMEVVELKVGKSVFDHS